MLLVLQQSSRGPGDVRAGRRRVRPAVGPGVRPADGRRVPGAGATWSSIGCAASRASTPLVPEGGLFVMVDVRGLGRPSDEVRRVPAARGGRRRHPRRGLRAGRRGHAARLVRGGRRDPRARARTPARRAAPTRRPTPARMTPMSLDDLPLPVDRSRRDRRRRPGRAARRPGRGASPARSASTGSAGRSTRPTPASTRSCRWASSCRGPRTTSWPWSGPAPASASRSPRGAAAPRRRGSRSGPGVILDCSKYFNRVLEINAAERWAPRRAGLRARRPEPRTSSRTGCSSPPTSRPPTGPRSAAWSPTTPPAPARSSTARRSTTCWS